MLKLPALRSIQYALEHGILDALPIVHALLCNQAEPPPSCRILCVHIIRDQKDVYKRQEYPLCDPDALCMLESGIYIRDYALKSVRYHLKNVYIPAFVGKVTLDSRLPVPLAELWHAILLWADYSGIGIKTALGLSLIHI